MRVAIVGTDLCAVDARGGGLEQVLRRWARWLAARHEVVVVSRRVGRPAPPTTEPFEVVDFARTADLGELLRDLRPDVVSLHNRPQWADRCPPGVPVAVTFHNYPPAWKVRPGPVFRTGRPVALSAVSSALAVAAAARVGEAAGAVDVTPPSIDPVYLAGGARRPERVVLAPNRLLRKKGVEELLAVARRPQLAAVTFSFADLISPWVRPTAEHRSLRAAVRSVPNATLFPPARTAEELAARYRSAAVVACPVREPEGLGLVALEAQACGTPLVTTDLGGLREATFSPNRCIPPGDDEALTAALVAALDEGTAASRPVRAQVRARHSPEASGAVFEAFVERAAGPARATAR